MNAPRIDAPDMSAAGPDAAPGAESSPGGRAYTTLLKRADFLRAAQAGRQGTAGFLLQGRDRGDGDPAIRVGYTCSKKIGNAVTRNRAKRRLRAAARAVLPPLARPGWDYVLVGRPGATVERSFADLCADLRAALDRVHRARAPRADAR
ncbi:MAG: ribonuclease P protein component [Gemmobacter sp.]